jgi:hypothetical protein
MLPVTRHPDSMVDNHDQPYWTPYCYIQPLSEPMRPYRAWAPSAPAPRARFGSGQRHGGMLARIGCTEWGLSLADHVSNIVGGVPIVHAAAQDTAPQPCGLARCLNAHLVRAERGVCVWRCVYDVDAIVSRLQPPI